MVNCVSLSALVAAVLLAAVECGPSGQKLATCCTKVSSQEVKEPIQGFLVQKANALCVQAVIFQTQSGLFCSYLRAPWVLPKIAEYRKAKARSTVPSTLSTSPVSLLSIITSTASPPPSSTALPSSSSSSQSSSGETFSESRKEPADV